MTSYEVSNGFGAKGYTFHAFYRPFRCLSSRELLSTIPEDGMTHFVTLTVPPTRTDHSLRHSNTRVGLRAGWFRILWLREKQLFRAIFLSYSTRFSAPGSTFSKPPGFLLNPCRWHLMRFPMVFGHKVHIPCLYGPFRCLCSRELLSIIPEDRMTHFVSLTVPPRRTDHSLRHSTTRIGLRAIRFRILWLRKKRPFRAIFVSYSTRFSTLGSTFSKPPGFLANPCRW
jgi:hypothetical protein